MCGIVGIYSENEKYLSKEILQNMRSAIKHRGPDDEGADILYNDGLALGHVRLSVLDLSKAGHQPMWNEKNDVAIIFNGEIYNFADIRKELEQKGYTFFSNCDTEVILKGYEEWGIDVIRKLNGMFAFAVWDKRFKKLWLVRDRLGKKPLYYSYNSSTKTLLFASEIKAIIEHPSIKREVDKIALNYYLALGYVPSPYTMFKGIKKVPAGFLVSFMHGKDPKVEKYWDSNKISTNKANKSYYKDNIRKILEDSVRLRLISDVPLGAFLSGGIDSTIIVGIMSRMMSQPVRTFSVAFDVGERSFKYNVDADAADLVSRHFGTKHTRITVDTQKNLMDNFIKCVAHMDEPHASSTNICTYLLSERVKGEGITVALSGDGSDEIFGGYPRYQYDMKTDLIRLLPSWVNSTLYKFTKDKPKFKKLNSGLHKAQLRPLSHERYLTWWEMFNADNRGEMLNSEWLEGSECYQAMIDDLLKNINVKSNQEAISYLDLKLWIAEESNMRMDKMTMANALESRAPFLDYRLVEYAMSIPFKQKASLGNAKGMLKDAFSDLLPDFVLNRPKWGFFPPVYYWVNMGLAKEAPVLLNSLTKTGIFKDSIADFIKEDFVNVPHKVWALMTFALWYDIYIDKIL